MSAKGPSRARIAPPLGLWGSLSAKGRFDTRNCGLPLGVWGSA
jgi:hypothetical protein